MFGKPDKQEFDDLDLLVALEYQQVQNTVGLNLQGTLMNR